MRAGDRRQTVFVTVAKPQQSLELVEPLRGDVNHVSARCVLEELEDICVVVVSGVLVSRFHREDPTARALFIAQAMSGKWASAAELSAAMGVCLSTVYRYARVYREDGGGALVRRKPGPAKGQRLEEAERQAIRKWHGEGVSGREIARRLRHAPVTVQKALARMGLPPTRSPAQQQALPGVGAGPVDPDDSEPAHRGDAVESDESQQVRQEPAGLPTTGMDPFDRSFDRFLASQGLLLDAEPIFASGENIPRLGALLALPLIIDSGLFVEAKRLYGDIGPAFYGLRTSLLVLVLMAVLRIKRPENLKEYSPADFGRIVGLDRAPEVKTLRRKLKRLIAGRSEYLLEALAKRRIATREEAMGFLYVDGHVRVYGGKHRLAKAHVTRMRMSLPATQDVWVNDAAGDPLFFVTMEAHPSLVTALPPILEEARELVGDERRITVVFDRGGWSPKLFAQMAATGFDVLTYRKGSITPIPQDHFEEVEVPDKPGRTWLLHERTVWVGSKKEGLWMRQVTRRRGDHQTHILTTRHDLALTEVAVRMFGRWRQENFFKYMRQEFAIDGLVEYGFEEEDQLRSVPNAHRRRADKAWKKARNECRKLKTAYAEVGLTGQEHPSEMIDALTLAQAEIDALKVERDALPQRVTIAELSDDERTVYLPALRKRLCDGIKMLAYQVESDLVRAIAPHYPRVLDEGRTLIAAAFQSSGELHVTDTELRITLAPQSSPHRTRAIEELCRLLDAREVCFPGTRLRVRYAIREAQIVRRAS